MELLTILAADYANLAEGGKLNVMGIFTNIYSQNFPARILSMFLVVKLGADLVEYDEERTLDVRLYDADANVLMRVAAPIKFPKPTGGQRPEINAIFQINEIVFPTPGWYRFSVFVDKDLKGDLSIDVAQVPQPSPEQKEA